jgi:cell division transport system permease protein
MINNWNKSILGSITVQIIPIHDSNKEKAQAQLLAYEEKAVEFLKSVNGIVKVTPLNNEQLNDLLRPWLGDDVSVSDLLTPRIIDVKLAKNVFIDFDQLREDLSQVSPQASLDSHKIWLNKLIALTDGLKLIAMTILSLVIAITSGAIFYTTQMSMGLHKEIIEILHIIGAKDTYIAQQYSKRMGLLGLIGGIFGLIFAIPAMFFIGNLANSIKGGIISDATLGIDDWLYILSLPLFSMAISMTTAYYTVKNTLKKML